MVCRLDVYLLILNLRVPCGGQEDRRSDPLWPAGGVLVTGGAGVPAAEGGPEEERCSRMALRDAEALR